VTQTESDFEAELARFRHMRNNFLDEQSKSASAAAASLQRDLEVQLLTAVTHSLHALLPRE